MKIIQAFFYKNQLGKEPVREWLNNLSKEEKHIIGTDIKTVELGWPIGMPVCRPLGKGLFEVRSTLPSNKIARIIFCIHTNKMVLLHSFIKKTQKMPIFERETASKRKKDLENEQ